MGYGAIIAALIAGGVAVAGQIQKKKAAERQKDAGDAAVLKAMKAIESGELDLDLTLSKELIDATDRQKQAYKEMEYGALQDSREALGAVKSGLRSGDPRTAGVMPTILASQADQREKIRRQSFVGMSEADMNLAKVAQELKTQEEASNINPLRQMWFEQLTAGRKAAGLGFASEQDIRGQNAAMGVNLFSALVAGGAFKDSESTSSTADNTLTDDETSGGSIEYVNPYAGYQDTPITPENDWQNPANWGYTD